MIEKIDIEKRNSQYEEEMLQFSKKHLGYIPNLLNPLTIQEKLSWLNLYDITQEKVDCADKVKLHEYSKKCLGKDICVPLLGVWNKSSEIDWKALPSKFTLKCNHGSGMNIIVSNKSSVNSSVCMQKLNRWLQDDFSIRNGYEAHYHWIERKIFAEEYLNDGHKDLIDYKFLCFNGKPTYCQIIGGRNESTRHLNYYDMDFNFVNISRQDFRNNPSIKDEKPRCFEEMKEYAKKLSKPFRFVRVDFYEVNGKVYLGEMTFTPGCCCFSYANKKHNLMMGDKLDLFGKVNICIIHYNTPELTDALVKSIEHFTPNSNIYIFDNSDKRPFNTAGEYDNVTVFDNTKGQIINFDEWLKKFPNRVKSNESTKSFGSAKHSYSIERCRELINDGFVLLDSDVLLKKDISVLFNPYFASIGEISTYGQYPVKRFLPYVNFVGKNKSVSYFNENYMRGLCVNTSIKNYDYYDTGANFYREITALKLPYRQIKCDDFVKHYKAGSWNGKHESSLSPIMWLKQNKSLWDFGPKTKVIYTCIMDGYDDINQPAQVDLDFDYVCFTNDKEWLEQGSCGVWQFRSIPEGLNDLSPVQQQRTIKICPHRYLSKYEISLWIDGGVQIKNCVSLWVDENIKKDKECSIFIPQHPTRKCIYEEAKACIAMKKDNKEKITKQINDYRKEQMPAELGMVQSNIIIRRHNDGHCKKLMEAWVTKLLANSFRDQLSFNYVLWKNPDVKIHLLDKMIYRSKWFLWSGSHKRKPSSKKEEKKTGSATLTKSQLQTALNGWF